MNSEYEDYMYGMRNCNNMMGCGCGYENMQMNPMMQPNCMNTMPNNNNVESMYPEIYKIVFPMVVRTCDSIRYMNMGNNFITTNMIEEMTENIYISINADEVSIETRDSEDSSEETRRPNKNNTLRDLIKILLIRELLRRGYNTYPNYGYRPYMY